MLYDYTVAIETTTVELIDRVLGVTRVVKLHESVTLFDDHIANATVTWTMMEEGGKRSGKGGKRSGKDRVKKGKDREKIG